MHRAMHVLVLVDSSVVCGMAGIILGGRGKENAGCSATEAAATRWRPAWPQLAVARTAVQLDD